ncbi:hypothetical protein QBC34DRAFT_484224 [Podospora aff. communis PSN243]|uniref:Uncharacterized protein n=1 Tax=Podospora aff. communis PSN243 TaxID=3040156 RepID=A0AAV9GUF4_9PEZI|nr:hypothetical protein QBC34DRAFT_484224 [Podospora aff. communis PSN243]
MDTSLQRYPIPNELRDLLLEELWKECVPDPKVSDAKLLSTYLNYYSTRCQHFSHDGGIHLCVKSHSNLASVAKTILSDKTREEVCSSLGSPPSDPDIDRARRANTTADLCASLLLMAEAAAKEGVHNFGFSGSTPLTWSSQQTLRQAVNQHFQPEHELQPDNPRLGKLFTARNLSYIGGIKIKWTNNIVDHLLLSDDDQTVFIFHYAGYLQFQQSLQHPLFPTPFLTETLRTLALLFPQNSDRKSRRWLHGQIAEHNLDPVLARCGNLRAQTRRFEQFSFWRDRLVILKQAFDESSPRGLTQWWNDRRNSVQWYTFWVAILVFVMTVFFGLVQSIEGALQVYISWKGEAGGAVDEGGGMGGVG